MPRLPHSLLHQARNISPFLPLLLRPCRTLSSAWNELRWLREHVIATLKKKEDCPQEVGTLLLQLCRQRSRGVPLQYLLGSQPFGELDILCRPGVLIPRSETEASTSHLARLLLQDPAIAGQDGLKILDICTGTGCISLLLHALLLRQHPEVQLLGVDISERALALARDNLNHNVMQGHLNQQALHQVSFIQSDILSNDLQIQGHLEFPSVWDIVVSNPPYISETGFNKDTNRSVRNWEPKLALVPPAVQNRSVGHSRVEDVFYHKILDIAGLGSARIVLMEVGDLQQALRVAQIALNMRQWNLVEVWRDWPDQEPDRPHEVEEVMVGQYRVRVRGSGHGRSVLCRK